jgi:carboxymethylenebutenolidase
MADADLLALWEAYGRYELEARDVDAAMATRVDRPYLHHIPTHAGGAS